MWSLSLLYDHYMMNINDDIVMKITNGNENNNNSDLQQNVQYCNNSWKLFELKYMALKNVFFFNKEIFYLKSFLIEQFKTGY